jgi:hypothetical protein
MPRPQSEMKVGELVALALDSMPQIVRHSAVWVHVEKDRACGDDARPGAPRRVARSRSRPRRPEVRAPIRRGPEVWRHSVLEHFQDNDAGLGLNADATCKNLRMLLKKSGEKKLTCERALSVVQTARI